METRIFCVIKSKNDGSGENIDVLGCFTSVEDARTFMKKTWEEQGDFFDGFDQVFISNAGNIMEAWEYCGEKHYGLYIKESTLK